MHTPPLSTPPLISFLIGPKLAFIPCSTYGLRYWYKVLDFSFCYSCCRHYSGTHSHGIPCIYPHNNFLSILDLSCILVNVGFCLVLFQFDVVAKGAITCTKVPIPRQSFNRLQQIASILLMIAQCGNFIHL